MVTTDKIPKNYTMDILSVGPNSQLKARMQQIIWHQETQNIVKVSRDKETICSMEESFAAYNQLVSLSK